MENVKMKPEFANLFTITANGGNGDVILSFYYEWQETTDGVSAETFKEKVASVVMKINDFEQLSSELSKMMEAAKKSGESEDGGNS
jgi:hypothetical protein